MCRGPLAILAGALLIGSLVTGCGRPRPGLERAVSAPWRATFGGESSDSESFSIPTIGRQNVVIDLFAGDVTIRATANPPGTGDEQGIAAVTITRRGMHGPTRKADSTASLPGISASVGAEWREGNSTIVVNATTTHEEPWLQAADVDITLPMLGSVVVRTSRGHVYITNNSRGVDIETSKGDVRVVTQFPMSDPTTILNRDGDIDWRVPGTSAGTYDLESVGGLVFARCPVGKWLCTDAANSDRRMFARLNDGSSRVVMRNVDGDIRIAVLENPADIGTYIWNP
ncbi:MAG: hypothetical protein FGM37_10840 [Phycisphaerales bacterium]|nr:hypothetical protein [Phycisphaerales bacterium]